MKLYGLLILIFACKFSTGQNLIANGSFEDVNVCEEYQAICSPAAWFFVAQKQAKGYFSLNHLPGTAGNKYISIDLARLNSPSRQYWETMLLCSLKAGHSYIASFQLTANDMTKLDLSYIQFLFVDSLVYSLNDTLLKSNDYLSFLDARIKKLKNNWITVKKEFVAVKDHQYLIVGNFLQENNPEVLKKLNRQQTYSLMIDDLSLSPKDALEDCPDITQRLDSLYSIKKRHLNLSPLLPADIADYVKTRIDTLVINNILFETNSYQIKDYEAFDKLKDHFATEKIKNILVTGFTDDVGSAEYNNSLSIKRAEEVGRLLMLRFGVPSEIILTGGRGISREYPAKAQNRRVEIYIYH